MATETDAARDRVLAARAALGDEIDALEASARAAVDIPAKVRASPAKAAAIAGSAGFVVLGGPKRIFGAARRAVFGPTAELPKQMLPKEIEKTLKKLGDDGDKVRGAIERDFAAYAKEAEKDRGVGAIAGAAARPLLMRGARGGGGMVPSTGRGRLPGPAHRGPRASQERSREATRRCRGAPAGG